MLKEYIKKYRDKTKYDLSCSETILHAANDAYNLNLDTSTFKAIAAFSGGMCIESVCGAVTASIAVLGILFTDKYAHNSPHMRKLVEEYLKKFQEKMTSRDCDKLKAKYRTEKEGCSYIIYVAGEILDEIVTRELHK